MCKTQPFRKHTCFRKTQPFKNSTTFQKKEKASHELHDPGLEELKECDGVSRFHVAMLSFFERDLNDSSSLADRRNQLILM